MVYHFINFWVEVRILILDKLHYALSK